MLYSTKTYQTQKKLTNWVRTGSNPKVPGTKMEGLKQYRRLFRNNINNTMEQAFPITFEVLNKEQWKQLIDDFFALHNAKTPHVWKLPFEFYRFVKKQGYSSKFNMPFLNDLLHFEWLEIEIFTMQDIRPEPYKKTGDLLNDRIECNNEFQLTQLKYPVHLFAAKESLKHSGDYYLLSYRMPETYEVKFIDFPVLHVLFFEKICNDRMSANEIIEEISDQNPSVDKEHLKQNIEEFIETMFSEKVFLGYSETYQN